MQSVLWVSIYVCIEEEKEEEMSSTAKDPPWSWTRSQHINTMHPKMTLVLGFTFDCLVLGIANLKTTIWNIVCTTLYYLKCLAWNAADLEYYGWTKLLKIELGYWILSNVNLSLIWNGKICSVILFIRLRSAFKIVDSILRPFFSRHGSWLDRGQPRSAPFKSNSSMCWSLFFVQKYWPDFYYACLLSALIWVF
jgi:hypothetical protein